MKRAIDARLGRAIFCSALVLVATWYAVNVPLARAAIGNYSLFKRLAFAQTSDSQPTVPFATDGGVGLFTTSPTDLTTLRVFSTSPTLLSPNSPFSPMQYSPGYWQSSQFYSSLEEMDTSLPSGDVFGYLLEGGDLGTRLALLPIPETNLFPRDIPYFTGNAFTLLDGMDPTEPFMLHWNGYTAPPAINDTPLFVNISRVSDGQSLVGFGVPNTVTSYEIPANTLAANTQYRADLSYSARLFTPDAGFTSADTYINFDYATNLYFTTATAGSGSAAPVVPEPASHALALAALVALTALLRKHRRSASLTIAVALVVLSSTTATAIGNYSLFKRIAYAQTSDAQPTTHYAMDGGVGLFTTDPAEVTSVRVFSTSPTVPEPVPEFTLTQYAPGFWTYGQYYPSLEAMDAALPNGDTFGYLIEGGTLGPQLALLTTPATNLFPLEIPYFTNNAHSELNGMDSSAEFTLHWNGYTPPAGINDTPVFLAIFRVSDGQFLTGTTALNTAASFVIPANTLAPDTRYAAHLSYSARIFTPDVGFSTADTYVNFDRLTMLEFMTAALLPGDYNGNGAVDAADYTVWRDSRGSITNLAADGNDSGQIDAGDLTVWQQNFGRTTGLGSTTEFGSIAIPEPASMCLALLLLGCVARRRA